MKIVVLDGYAANPGDLSWDELKSLGECTVYDRTAPAEVLERAAGADILLTNKVVLDATTIAALPQLKYIGVLATGYNIIDTAAAKERGITVTNIPAYSTPSVAQMVFAHILNITQRVQHYTDEIHKGRWTNSPDFCFWDTPLIELSGKKIGIIGLGQTGYNTARIAIGFGMEVHAYTSKSPFQLPPEIKKTELDELFVNCDIISLHCPLTDSTRELVNAARLKQMKPNAILINTGRGPLVNEQDLADALNNGTIFAAGLDVLSQEPPEIKKTELDELFVNCDIISLHCPLTDSTRELVNAARLKQMKPNAILINTGRGPLVNEQDLADALNNGTIFAAGLDVLSQEPPRADNPLLTARNCYITPHIAWASAAARERLMQIMLDNIKAFLDEKPINSVIK